MAHAMGGEASTYTKQLGALQGDTVSTTFKLQQQFHMLTAAQFDHVIALVKSADATGDFQKRQEAIREVIAAIDGPIQKQTENTGYLAQAWRGVTQAIGGAVEAMMNWGRAPSTQSQLESALLLVDRMKQVRDVHGQIPPKVQAEIDKQEALIRVLSAKANAERAIADEKARQQQSDSEAIRKAYEAYSGGNKAAPKSRVGEWMAELDERLAAEKKFFNDSQAEELKYWQTKLAIPNLTKAERRQIIKSIYEIEKAEARTAYADDISNIRAGEQAKVDALRSSMSAQGHVHLSGGNLGWPSERRFRPCAV